MVRETGPERLALLAVHGNDYISLLLRKRWTIGFKSLWILLNKQNKNGNCKSNYRFCGTDVHKGFN